MTETQAERMARLRARQALEDRLGWTAMALMVTAIGLSCLPPPHPTTPPTCSMGQHVWENYHLAHDALSPVIDNQSSYVVPIAAWNAYDAPVKLRAAGTGFTITVKDGGDASSTWLGLATVSPDGNGHIRRGTVTMNRTLLERYPEPYRAYMIAHVMWQELGHLAGLDHQRGVDDSAMDDCGGRSPWRDCLANPEALEFNQHDVDQLVAIYAHVTGDALPPGCSSSDEGEVIVHEFPVEGGVHGH